MKFRIFGLVAIAFLGLAITGPTADAHRVTFAYTGNLITWTAPATGLYRITAFGAQGGSGDKNPAFVGAGGLGAEIGGDFALTAGEILQIAAGGSGASLNGGGG